MTKLVLLSACLAANDTLLSSACLVANDTLLLSVNFAVFTDKKCIFALPLICIYEKK